MVCGCVCFTFGSEWHAVMVGSVSFSAVAAFFRQPPAEEYSTRHILRGVLAGFAHAVGIVRISRPATLAWHDVVRREFARVLVVGIAPAPPAKKLNKTLERNRS